VKNEPTRDEVTEWVKAYMRGETCKEIAARVGRSPGVVNAKLKQRGAYLFQRSKAKP
jgi:hypothetical protein